MQTKALAKDSFVATYYLGMKAQQLNAKGFPNPYNEGLPWDATTTRQAFTDSGLDALDHFLIYGSGENLAPNPYFNDYEYLAAKVRQTNSIGFKNPADDRSFDVASMREYMAEQGMLPYTHYLTYGKYETDADGNFINPSNAFDVNAYLAAKLLQVRQSGEEIEGKTGDAVTMW